MADNLNVFTIQELDLLFDALDLWENENSASVEAGGTFFGSILQGNQVDLGQILKAANEKNLDDHRNRKARSAMLKAKIVQMKDKLVVAENVKSIMAEKEDKIEGSI